MEDPPFLSKAMKAYYYCYYSCVLLLAFVTAIAGQKSLAYAEEERGSSSFRAPREQGIGVSPAPPPPLSTQRRRALNMLDDWKGNRPTKKGTTYSIYNTLSHYFALDPSPTPSPTPTTALPLPPGPYIAAGYSETITIPQPPNPSNLGDPRQDCPHLEAGLTDWNSLGLSPALPGADVVLPANTKVLISSSINIKLGTVTIPASSELVIGENESGISLDMDGMIVQGRLVAGSELCRLETPVVITLHGSRPIDAVTNPPPPQVKGIAVTGEISLHGKRFFRTWTRLSKTVEVGERVLMLQDPVNWSVGQEILLVTTALKDSREWHQNEVLTVEYVFPSSPTGTAIQVSSPVQYRHLATENYQAEVGLLTRTIKIQGSQADSEPTDPDPLNCTGISRYGDSSRPCGNTGITGYGAHVMVYGSGVGYIEGIELYRVGQTNVLGRYPMHFHLLGDCPQCYFKDSSVHRSYYRCISIHGTHSTTVTENVAYDVTGFCYYLEDGVETKNLIGWNLAAHIHMIGPEPPHAEGKITKLFIQSDILTLPADVTSSGFYITNIDNDVIGNAASGGWAGFAFPNLETGLGPFRDLAFRPSSATGQGFSIDGNTAHSTAWWWKHAGAFHFGSALYFENGVLTYNPGLSFRVRQDSRNTCSVDFCELRDNCLGSCSPKDQLWVRLTNSKAFLSAGVGMKSWSGRMEIIGFESHDNGLSVEAFEKGVWIDNMLTVCRSGEEIARPTAAQMTQVRGDGFVWYETDQKHIITNSTFRQCGYRSEEFNQYDSSPDRGCGDDSTWGCSSESTVFGLLGYSDQLSPEIMQGTSGIAYESCGRRFAIYRDNPTSSTNSGRIQNWLDMDGSVSGLNEPALIGSGLADSGLWWSADDSVVRDEQGPLVFVQRNGGPDRGLGFVKLEWDNSIHSQVGDTLCSDEGRTSCPTVGYVRHTGPRFSDDLGLPITANADIVGLTGGYGWYLTFLQGPPRRLKLSSIELDPDTVLIVSIAYPVGTLVNVTAHASDGCRSNTAFSCSEVFQPVSSRELVRQSPQGNAYHLSEDGILTFRVVQTGREFVGNPNWFVPSWDDIDRNGVEWILDRFERKGVRLPSAKTGPYIEVVANCGGAGPYCTEALAPTVELTVDSVCPVGYTQSAYDQCCSTSGCVFANGQSSL